MAVLETSAIIDLPELTESQADNLAKNLISAEGK